MRKTVFAALFILLSIVGANAQVKFKQIKYFGTPDTLTMYYPADDELIKTYDAERVIATVNDTVSGDQIIVERMTDMVGIDKNEATATMTDATIKSAEETQVGGQSALRIVYKEASDSACYEKYIINFDNTYRYDITFKVTSPSRYTSFYQTIYKMVKSVKLKK